MADEMAGMSAAATVVYMAGMKASALAGAKVAQQVLSQAYMTVALKVEKMVAYMVVKWANETASKPDQQKVAQTVYDGVVYQVEPTAVCWAF